MSLPGRIGIAASILLISGASAMADVKATHLRCEYLTNPLAIDVPQPRLSWIVEADTRGARQAAWQILVAGDRKTLDGDRGDLWDSGRVTSAETNQIRYGGPVPGSGRQVFWKVRIWLEDGSASDWSEVATWRMGMLEPAAWKAAWIHAPGEDEHRQPLPARPVPLFRKRFHVAGPVRRAFLTASALGVYDARINGRPADDRRLAPEWTDYHKRVQYQTFDVTDLLQPGENVLAAMVADGWYAGRLGISHVVEGGPLRGHYGLCRRFLAQLEITYHDGTVQTVATDGTWRSLADGPIRKACLLDGEVYDARMEPAGWDAPGFDDSAWAGVGTLDRIPAPLVAQPNEPIRVTEELRPTAITEPSPGTYVVDFGQVVAGCCRITVRGAAGDRIRLRHAEMLQDDGHIYRDNLRMKPYEKINPQLGARQEDEFICAGGGEETFEPRFTYHGFRYVEVVGTRPDADRIVARVFHSTPPPAGSFECSSPMLNRLMRNIVWTHRDNLHGVPTDCPQRDERMGWSGDMLVFAQAACFNMDMAAFFTKWARDLSDDRSDDGRFPDFAPQPYDPNVRFSGNPAWGDVGVIIPWRTYVNYNDRAILAEHFEACRGWVDFIHRHNPDLLWKNEQGRPIVYGDWLNGDTLQLEGFPKGEAEMPRDVFATGFFQQSAALVARMAGILGHEDHARHYAGLADGIREAFIRAYVRPDGRVENHTQAAYALALAFDLVPQELRPAAVEHLLERIRAYRNHISTGFLTTILLMKELTRNGRNDVACMLINNRTIPSWGYTIEQGATTIWERWDGYVAGRGFQDPNMNSFCHYAIGSVGEWMYRVILGINPDEQHPGYRHVILSPRPGGGLTWARGHYDSICGRIAVEWRLQGDDMHLTVAVPANTTATLRLPAGDLDGVTEGDRPAASAPGVRSVHMEPGVAVCHLGSGTYRFVSRRAGG